MAKPPSKSPRAAASGSSRHAQSSPASAPKNTAKQAASPRSHAARRPKLRHFCRKCKSFFLRLRTKIRTFRSQRVILHHSFQRSYREDYIRKTATPGLLTHAMTTFQTIFRHWRTFLPLILVMMVFYITLVGLMSEDFYQQFQSAIDTANDEMGGNGISAFAKAALLLFSTVTTGGLDSGMDEVGTTFMILLFIIMWLVTIFLLRHFAAGESPKLRDGLYNALSPLLSTLVVFVIIFIQAIPLMLVLITFNAAQTTGFLDTPFYALVYFIFAALMLLISLYLFSSSLMGLVAVTAPGVYPLSALFAASDLMAGRRLRFVLRILFLVVVVALIYVITMLPIILLDLWLKSIFSWLAGVPIVPFFLLFVTCFVFIYFAAYLYRYYRYLIDYREN